MIAMKISENLDLLAVGAIFLIACGWTLMLMMPREEQFEGQSFDFSAVQLSRVQVRFLGWVVEYDQASASDFSSNAAAFTWVSPTGMFIDEDGKLQGRMPGGISQAARNNGVLNLPLVANRNFNRQIAHKVLTDAETRSSVIDQLTRFIQDGEYDGVNIDFEDVPESDRDHLTDFMRLLADRLRPEGKLTTIDVPAKTYDATTGWAGAFDYRALGEICDLVIIMVYDYHWSTSGPGPISPLGWFEDVVKYSTSVIPKEKLVIGIPFYGYDWPAGGSATGLSFSQALAIAESVARPIAFDENSGEYTFAYSRGGVRREVWFQGAKSTELRLQLLGRYGLNQVAAWRIGQEDPRTWEVIGRE